MPVKTEEQEILSLANIDGGDLETQFREAYKHVVNQLRHGETGTVAINLQIKRVPDTDTLVTMKYSVAPKLPTRAQGITAKMTTDGLLKEEIGARRPKADVRQLTVLTGQE